MKRINILAVSNGVGITKDVQLIKEILSAEGYDVEANHTFRFEAKHTYDLNIFLERFNPPLFKLAEKNIIVPNQEWFELGWLPMLKVFDVVFTKTKFADRVFQELGKKTEYISFTSEDCYDASIRKDDFHWLHLAGKSIQKQTEVVVSTWEKNPGFPQLTIIQDPKFFKQRSTLKNVNFMYDRLPQQLLRAFQNSCSIHVCPSETEGFGHYIMEAMSCKNVVLTTDAAPMTELVSKDNGILVQPVRSAPMRLSVAHTISEDTLEKAVIETIITPDATRRTMGEAARAFFLQNDAFFRRRLVEAVANVLQ